MRALDQAIEHLTHVRTDMRLRWANADDNTRKVIETDEHRVSLALQLLTEQQESERVRRNGVPWRVAK